MYKLPYSCFIKIHTVYGIIADKNKGYITRILRHQQPVVHGRLLSRSRSVCLILAPTFICAGIYITLKHVALAVGLEPRALSFTAMLVHLYLYPPSTSSVSSVRELSEVLTPSRRQTWRDKTSGTILSSRESSFSLQSSPHLDCCRLEGTVAIIIIIITSTCPLTIILTDTMKSKVRKDPRFRIFCMATTATSLGILMRYIYRYVVSGP